MRETVMSRLNEVKELSFDEALERGRKWWKASPGRVIDCDRLLVLDRHNRVIAAGQVAGVRKDLEDGSGRIEILVAPDPGNSWLGKVVQRPASRNPVVYVSGVEEVSGNHE